MGVNDAREQLEVCKDEYGKLERQLATANAAIDLAIAKLRDPNEGTREIPDYNEWADRYRVINAEVVLLAARAALG
jgi:hypothetical protein